MGRSGVVEGIAWLSGWLSLIALAGCDGHASSAGSASPSPTRTPHPLPRTITVPPPDPLPAGLHLSFIQQRIDEGTPRSQVRVINGDADPVHVISVGVDWAGYPLRLRRTSYDVPGQSTVDLRYLLPRADCSASAGKAPITAVAVVRTGSGAGTGRRTVRRAMPADGRRFLQRLWRTECNQRLIERAVDVEYAGPWTVTGSGEDSVLHGSLALTRRHGDDRVRVTQAEGSVLFDLAAEGTLSAGDPTGRVPLTITPGRCDEHARSQSTQTFVFRVWLSLDDGPELARVVVPDHAVQVRLLTFLDTACKGNHAH